MNLTRIIDIKERLAVTDLLAPDERDFVLECISVAVGQEMGRLKSLQWDWTCGHTAGAHCAECYRILAAKAHELAEENLALRGGPEPTDAQIEAALAAYWTVAFDHAKAQTPDNDKVMRESMRAALLAALPNPFHQ